MKSPRNVKEGKKMSKLFLGKRGLIILIAGFVFIIMPSSLTIHANQEDNSDNRVWIGQVTITLDREAHLDKDESTQFKKKTYSKNHNVHESVTIKACGKPDRLCVSDVSWSIVDTFHEESFMEEDHRICPLTKEQMKHNPLYRQKHYPPNIKKPGDSSTSQTTSTMDLYSGPNCPSLTDQASVTLSVFPDGRYILSAFGTAFVSTTHKSIEKYHYACSGGTKIDEVYSEPGSFGQEAKSTMVSAGEGDNAHTIIKSIQPPIGLPLNCYVEGKRNFNTISGHKLLGRETPKNEGDYSGKAEASWNFVYKHPADYLADCFAQCDRDLDAEIESCFRSLNVSGGCERSKLLSCFKNYYRNEVKGLLNFSQCIDNYCGYSGLKELSEDDKIELWECIGEAILEYEEKVKKCNQDYNKCVGCLDHEH
jgi:hypothetical protein